MGNARKKITAVVLAAALAGTLFLSGCGLWNPEPKPIDPPQVEQYVEQGKSLDPKKADEAAASTKQTIATELYLLDANGLVVPRTLPLPKTLGVAKQALQYLVKGGPVQNLLPNGFQAVLPAGTEVLGVNLTDSGTLTVNFSEEFKNYKAAHEDEILQSITWTATQFETVDRVKIQIDGVAIEEMPVNHTPIGKNGVSRAAVGINNATENVVDITATSGVTVYYPAQNDGEYYYVPVTKRIAKGENHLQAIVESLLHDPILQAGLLDEFGDDVKLLSAPSVDGQVVTLNFNSAFYSNMEKNMISEEALNSLVLSLTAQKGIEKVAIQVNGKMNVKSETGETITAPVSRPEKVNAVEL